MVERAKKLQKVSFGEDDLSSTLQRYTARTVLTLLQEVDQFSDVKIDWNELVKKSSTGIDNAREYQMLWRHLAYRTTLLDKLEDGAEPMDDDSDLEIELETNPPANSEASNDAAAFVKVLSDSAGLASDSSLPNNSAVEGPLIINIPTGQSSRAPSENSGPACLMQGTNIAVPVFVQKQSPAHKPLSTVTSAEGLDSNGFAGGSLPPRRKRKPWSEAEDLELIAAVNKCGEGNWANILRGDFKGDRTASQLSQRWAIIRKRHGNVNLGGANTTGPQQSEAVIAARHAMSVAFNMPVKHSPTASTVGPVGTTLNTTTSNTMLPPTTETSKVGSSDAQIVHQYLQGSIPPKSSPMGSMFPLPKPRVIAKKTSAKSNVNAEYTLKAAAFAAGARIASQSDAESLLKAAQANNAVHIMPTSGSLVKSSMPGVSGTQPGAHPNNVHYIITGLAGTPHSTHPSANALRPSSVKSATTTIQHTPTSSTPSTMSPDLTNAFMSSLATENPVKQDVKAVEEIKVSESDNKPKEQVYKRACLSGNKRNEPIREDKTAATNSKADLKSAIVLKTETAKSDEPVAVGRCEQSLANDIKVTGLPVKKEDENQSAVQENGKNQSTNEKQMDLPCTADFKSCKQSSS